MLQWISVPHNQTSFFDTGKEEFNLPDAEIILYRHFFDLTESNLYFENLLTEVAWEQESILMFGKMTPLPRLTAWYGDPKTSYTYSSLKNEPLPWSEALLEIRQQLSELTDGTFNSVLLNLYRNGSDSVAWHADDEKELGVSPTIASVSFGQTRKFAFKKKDAGTEVLSIDLNHGDVLIMSGETQQNYLHQIPRSAKKMEPRINMTFRSVYTPDLSAD